MSLLMASDPNVSELVVVDLTIAMFPPEGVAADLSHLENPCKVTGIAIDKDKPAVDELASVLPGADLVLIPAGMPRKPGMTRADLLTVNADIAKGLVEACAKHCPKAVLALIVNPVNSVVPAMCALWEKAGLDPRKIVGVTTLDVVRANKFVKEKTGQTTGVDIPVIGGHAGTTILPLFSQCKVGSTIPAGDIPDMDKAVQDAGTVVVNAKAGKGSATLSMAYAGARLGKAIVKGILGIEEPVECAYIKSGICDGLEFFASKVKFGKNGAEEALPIGTLSAHEQARLEELKPALKEEIQAGLDYAKDRSFAI